MQCKGNGVPIAPDLLTLWRETGASRQSKAKNNINTALSLHRLLAYQLRDTFGSIARHHNDPKARTRH